MKSVFVSLVVSRLQQSISYLLVHPRPRVNLDINFGEKVGGRITVEVGQLGNQLLLVIC